MKSRKFIVLALSFMMVLSMSAFSVFAADGDTPAAGGDTPGTTTQETNVDPVSGTAADNAYLVKYLKFANGVTNPQIEFTFKFAPKDNAPAITDQKITPATASESTTDGASVVGSKKISEILPNYTHAGVYIYEVTETATAAGFTNGEKETTLSDGTVKKEKVTFSTEKYTLEVRIANNGQGGLEPAEVSIKKDGEETKTDATDPDPSVTKDENNQDVDHGTDSTIPGFSFTNTYEKSTKKPVDPDPTDPTQGKYGAAGITKTVVGAYGDQTFEFPFTITMNAGTGITATSAEAYIYTGDTKGSKVTVTFGTATDFTLKHGQSLIFEELPDGVSYTVSEKLQGCGVKDETKYMAAFNGTPTGTQGASSLNNAVTVSDAATAENDAHFTNTLDSNDVTPTGIIINNLPYVLLIGLALGGIVLFSRKRRYE